LLGYVDKFQSKQQPFEDMSSGAYGKHFRSILDSFGITDKKLVLHSFHHTFTDALRETKLTEPIVIALIGHVGSSVTAQYGSRYPLDILYGNLKWMKYLSVILP